MTALTPENFARLCALDLSEKPPDPNGIGTYNEKRLHRIIKKFVCDDESCFEQRVGKYVADVLCDGVISEVQTGSFYPLKEKLGYYIGNTDLSVRIYHPITAGKRIIRIDPRTGEILRSRMSPSKNCAADILPELFWISGLLDFGRVSVVLLAVNIEEYRYSDTVYRYRKSGRYDAQRIPVSLENVTVIDSRDSLRSLLPRNIMGADWFTVSDFSRESKIRGRKAYSAVNALCTLGVLERSRDGRTSVFRCV